MTTESLKISYHRDHDSVTPAWLLERGRHHMQDELQIDRCWLNNKILLSNFVINALKHIPLAELTTGQELSYTHLPKSSSWHQFRETCPQNLWLNALLSQLTLISTPSSTVLTFVNGTSMSLCNLGK